MKRHEVVIGEKYRTQEGRTVRILCTDGWNPTYPVVGLIEAKDQPAMWTKEGKTCFGGPSMKDDLVPVPDSVHVHQYLNVYTGGYSLNFETREEADRSARRYHNRRVACLEIDVIVKNGHGLNNTTKDTN